MTQDGNFAGMAVGSDYHDRDRFLFRFPVPDRFKEWEEVANEN